MDGVKMIFGIAGIIQSIFFFQGFYSEQQKADLLESVNQKIEIIKVYESSVTPYKCSKKALNDIENIKIKYCNGWIKVKPCSVEKLGIDELKQIDKVGEEAIEKCFTEQKKLGNSTP